MIPGILICDIQVSYRSSKQYYKNEMQHTLLWIIFCLSLNLLSQHPHI